MAPIHDTDLAEERWSKAEWEHFELWEKIEQQMRRRRRKWNVAVAVAFLVIVAIPPAIDRWPRWEALWLTNRLAQEIGALKRRAAVERQAFRIRFESGGKLAYTVEKAASCDVREPKTEVARAALTSSASRLERFRLIDPATGVAQGIPGLVDVLCYDPVRGMTSSEGEGKLVGFAITPVNDLANGRKDRVSVLLVSGLNGELSFE
jgi:hypothetical protein